MTCRRCGKDVNTKDGYAVVDGVECVSCVERLLGFVPPPDVSPDDGRPLVEEHHLNMGGTFSNRLDDDATSAWWTRSSTWYMHDGGEPIHPRGYATVADVEEYLHGGRRRTRIYGEDGRPVIDVDEVATETDGQKALVKTR